MRVSMRRVFFAVALVLLGTCGAAAGQMRRSGLPVLSPSPEVSVTAMGTPAGAATKPALPTTSPEIESSSCPAAGGINWMAVVAVTPEGTSAGAAVEGAV